MHKHLNIVINNVIFTQILLSGQFILHKSPTEKQTKINK